jgi:hypothetical protein
MADQQPVPALPTAFLMVIPNAMMWKMAYSGSGQRIINTVLRSPMGAHGLLLIPFVGIFLEKSFYDSAMSLQGIDPNAVPNYHSRDKNGASVQSFPGGGYNLPSLSVFPVKHVKDYFS